MTYGPASALYGANAFQGIIHVITKTAEEMAGGRVSTTVGSLGTRAADVAYGGAAGGVELSLAGRLSGALRQFVKSPSTRDRSAAISG